MEFKMEISLDNEAFDDSEELSRILVDLANNVSGLDFNRELSPFDRSVKLFDSNGNIVGKSRLIGTRRG